MLAIFTEQVFLEAPELGQGKAEPGIIPDRTQIAQVVRDPFPFQKKGPQGTDSGCGRKVQGLFDRLGIGH
jgi:hypothetical protein